MDRARSSWVGGEGRPEGPLSPTAPGPHRVAMIPVATGDGEGKSRSVTSSCAGQPWCSCTLSLPLRSWVPAGSGRSRGGLAAPCHPMPPGCAAVSSAQRGQMLPRAWSREGTGWSQHWGLRPGTAQCMGHCREPSLSPAAQLPSHSQSPHTSTAYQPIPHCHLSLHLPPSLVLLPPTTIKQHPGLTNHGLPPSASPQPTMCRHLSLLLSRPSQQQLTNRRERETTLSQSRAATYQLSQPIRGSHSPPRGIKGSLCWGSPTVGEMMVPWKSLLPLRSWGGAGLKVALHLIWWLMPHRAFWANPTCSRDRSPG